MLPVSEEEFVRELYLEHLEEASFLYQQRLTLLADVRMEWSRIGEFEERLQAHLDALVTGGDEAYEICAHQGVEGDAGALFAAVCVFCRQGRKDLVWEVIEGLDPQIEARLQAVSDALRYELPDFWGDEFVQNVIDKRPNATVLLARTAGYRRLSPAAGPELMKILPGKDSQETCEIISALGRLRFRDAQPVLLDKYLAIDDELIRAQAAQTLLILGETQALPHCLQYASSQDWPNTFIGISSGRSAVSVLLKKSTREKPGAECLLGLGFSGDVPAVESLVAGLADPTSAESAALALNLITGADIYEDAFIPDEITEDELFPEELEKFRQGQPPSKPDGTPYGVNVARLSQKPEDWRGWWATNGSRFKDGIRYRNGQPFSPACLVDNIKNEKSPFKIRQLAYEELVVRYGADFPFAADMYVTQQKRILQEITRWVSSNANRFQPGSWYFAGQLIL